MSDPPDTSHTRPSEAVNVEEVLRATELVAAVSNDLAQLSRETQLHRTQLEALEKQVTYLRETLDYALSTTPESAVEQSDLYPLTSWFKQCFTELRDLHSGSRATAELEELASGNRDSSVGEESRTLHRELGDSVLAVRILLENLSGQIRALLAEQEQQREKIGSFETMMSTPQGPSPYDDFDIQVEELRNYLDEKTSRWKLQENLFYGVVVLLLLLNFGVSIWLGLTV